MDARFVVFALVLGLGAAAYTTLGAPPGPPQVRAFTLDVVAFACDEEGDGVCLGYEGAAPGPMLDVNLGDTIEITLVNRIAETLPPGAPAHLATADVSWHVHGTAVPVEMDGVAAHPGTQLVESVAHPGGSFTYRTRAAFVGSWHYHDHVIGLDGDEGARRGLYGGLIVRNGAEARPDVTLDLHLLDAGANGGHGMSASVPAGSHLEILVVGLENLFRHVELRDPDGALVDELDTAPGLSDRLVVPDAQPGTYTWSATGPGLKTGTVVVS